MEENRIFRNFVSEAENKTHQWVTSMFFETAGAAPEPKLMLTFGMVFVEITGRNLSPRNMKPVGVGF
jgi:hypothetical protein